MPRSQRTVLLVTHTGDFYTVDRVAEALDARGARPVRLDTDRFPMEIELGCTVRGAAVAHHLRVDGVEITGDQVAGVWLRRFAPPRLTGLDPAYGAACARESGAALEGFWDGLGHCRFVNPPDRNRAAENKLYQLRLAAALGLEVPRTLVSNDRDAVRRFVTGLEGGAVVKMLTPVSQSMDGGGPFVYTSALTAADLDDLDGLEYSPMVFQERVEKALELRVAVVGRACFAGAMDASRSVSGQVDWRRAAPDECPWQQATVPGDVAATLVKLLAALGLGYGAADLIVTPEGRHVFLEINPAGEWGMLERHLGLPIAAALAAELVGP